MANNSRLPFASIFEGLDGAVLTTRGDFPGALLEGDPERPSGEGSPAVDAIAPLPSVGKAPPLAAAPLSRDSLTLALSLVTGVAAAAGSGAPPEPQESVDLDAIDSQIHSGRCVCAACSGAGRTPLGRSSATVTGGPTDGASAMPAASLQTLADYLTTGFWLEAGTYARKYNLTSGGTGAKNGVITYNITGWANDGNGLSADRQALTREVFKLYSAVLGITFREVSGSGGDIRFTDNDSGAYAYLASGWYADSTRRNVIIDYSVVNVQASWYDGRSNYATYTPQTIFHEIGHALGLGHQGQYNYTGTPLTYATSAQFANDSWQATMMSYWDQAENTTTGASFAWLQTPMAVDWIALDGLYRSQGYSTDKAFQGDTVYGVGTNISASVSQIWNLFSTYAGSTAYTLVDGGGYDILNVSNFGANQRINLAPSQLGSTAPSVSNIGGLIGNLSIAAGTLIESAIGGSGNDVFLGNSAANTFWGNAGADSFYDSVGSDIYYGGDGSDWLYFDASLELFSYELAGDSLLFSRSSGSGDVDQVWSDVESISFNTIAYSFAQLVSSLTPPPALPAVTITSVNGLSSGAATNSTALVLSGSLSQALGGDQTIAVYRNGTLVGIAQPVSSGATAWSFSLQESTGTNSVSYTARVEDTANGRLGELSGAFALTVDTDVPLITVTNLATPSVTPLLSGTVSEGTAQVSISIGGLTRSAVNDGNGGWSLQWTDPLSPGTTYDVVATASDAAGNIGSDSSSNELSVLLPLPEVTITSVNGLSSGAATNSTALVFSGSLSQALGGDQTIVVYRNGTPVGIAQPVSSGATTWSFSLQESTGTNSFSYTARVLTTGGPSGELSSPFALTVDTVAPLISVDSLDTFNTTPLLGGTVDDPSAQIVVTIDGRSSTATNNGDGRWSLPWSDSLAPGRSYDVVATASDAAGNRGSDSSTNELIIRTDDYAANSSTTGVVSLGGNSTGVLELSGDRDWFAVQLQAGQSYEFRLNGTTLANPLLRLWSDSGSELASNDDINSSNPNSLISFTAASSGRHFLEAAAFNNAGTGAYSVAATDVTPPPASNPLVQFSLANAVTTASPSVLGGLTARTNDIIAFDGSRFTTWLNGNASGLSGAVLRDFHIVSADEVVVAFQSPVTLAGIAFDDSDLARLSRSGSGFAISMMFDGSDVGLTANSEAIDAITGLADGSWLISTRGGGGVTGVSSFAAEDILQFRPTSLGTSTSGGWSLYADMSDVGISGSTENIAAVDVGRDGRVFLATTGNVSASAGGSSVAAANEDVVVFQPTQLGGTTTGTFQSSLFFDGSLYGLGANAIQGLDVPV